MLQRTLVLIKPDGIRRSLVGEIIGRFERRGLKFIGMKMQWINKEFAMKHYTDDIAQRRGEKVRTMLIDYIQEGPILAFVLEGVNAIEVVRQIVGGTEPKSAIPGSIRGDFCHVSYSYADKKGIAIKNLIHASGDAKDAEHEVKLWFTDKELHSYKLNHDHDIL